MATNQISTSPYLLSDANQATYNYGQLPPEQALEEQALNRKQHIANLLLQQGISGAGTNKGQMVGRFYVPASPLQGLADLAKIGVGMYGTHLNDEARQGLTAKSNEMLADAVANYHNRMADVPAVAGPAGVAGEAPQAQLERLLAPGGDQSNLPQTIANNVNFGAGEGPPVHPMTGAPLGEPPSIPPIPPGEGVALPPIQAREQVAQAMAQQPVQGPVSPDTPARPRTPEERQQALIDLMANPHPQVARLGQLLQGLQEKQDERAMLHEEKLAGLKESGDLKRQLSDIQQKQFEMTHENAVRSLDQQYQMNRDRMQDSRTTHEDKMRLEADQHRIERERLALDKAKTTEGKTPPGYRQTPEGNLQAIPGGPADIKQQGVLNQDTSMLQSSNAAFDRLGASANALLNHPGLGGITGLRGKIPNIPGSAAADADAQLQTLKSQIGFGVMQELRNNSKTGSSGLGALSDAEGKRLEQNLAALDKAQSLEQMKSSLKSILDYTNGAKDRLRDAFNIKHKNALPEAAAPSPAPAAGGLTAAEQQELDMLKKKYGR